jgi:hypothetical protein
LDIDDIPKGLIIIAVVFLALGLSLAFVVPGLGKTRTTTDTVQQPVTATSTVTSTSLMTTTETLLSNSTTTATTTSTTTSLINQGVTVTSVSTALSTSTSTVTSVSTPASTTPPTSSASTSTSSAAEITASLSFPSKASLYAGYLPASYPIEFTVSNHGVKNDSVAIQFVSSSSYLSVPPITSLAVGAGQTVNLTEMLAINSNATVGSYTITPFGTSEHDGFVTGPALTVQVLYPFTITFGSSSTSGDSCAPDGITSTTWTWSCKYSGAEDGYSFNVNDSAAVTVCMVAATAEGSALTYGASGGFGQCSTKMGTGAEVAGTTSFFVLATGSGEADFTITAYPA